MILSNYSEQEYYIFHSSICSIISEYYDGNSDDIADIPEYGYPMIFTFLQSEEDVVDIVILEAKRRLLSKYTYSGNKTFIDDHNYWSLMFELGCEYEFETIL